MNATPARRNPILLATGLVLGLASTTATAATYYVELTVGDERRFAQRATLQVGAEPIDDLQLALVPIERL